MPKAKNEASVNEAKRALTKPRQYKGRLYYKEDEDDCHIDVHSLVEHQNHVSIDLTTTWPDYERWSVNTIAKMLDSSFTTGKVRCIDRDGAVSDADTTISFSFISQSETRIKVDGTWTERGETHPFGGELVLEPLQQ